MPVLTWKGSSHRRETRPLDRLKPGVNSQLDGLMDARPRVPGLPRPEHSGASVCVEPASLSRRRALVAGTSAGSLTC